MAVIAILMGISLPSFSKARRQADLIRCAWQLHGIHTALMGYSSANGFQMPPFAFDSWPADLPRSGHWGGSGHPKGANPGMPGQGNVRSVNLWILLQANTVNLNQLICPSADNGLREGSSGYFPLTKQFSTYCLRFPFSRDLFTSAPMLAGKTENELLAVYLRQSGGQNVRIGTGTGRVPLVRLDRVYGISAPAGYGDGDFAPSNDALLSDTFWMNGYASEQERWAWCHDQTFNVLTGAGAVRAVSDDGTVAGNSYSPGCQPARDNVYYATYAERIWQFFDRSP